MKPGGRLFKSLTGFFKKYEQTLMTFREDLERKECMAEIKEGMLTIFNDVFIKIMFKPEYNSLNEVASENDADENYANADDSARLFFTDKWNEHEAGEKPEKNCRYLNHVLEFYEKKGWKLPHWLSLFFPWSLKPDRADVLKYFHCEK